MVHELIGKKYSRLTVAGIEKVGSRNLIVCVCDCGNESRVRRSRLLSGETISCGCYASETTTLNKTTHGLRHTSEYNIWRNMRRRCDDPKANKYENYGGRGITYCRRWESVENFVADMGRRPSENHTLDRINPDGNYEPSNCKWSTTTEQNNNRRTNVLYEYQGKTYLLTELSEMYNVKYTTIQERLKRGWSLEKALTHPVQKRTK